MLVIGAVFMDNNSNMTLTVSINTLMYKGYECDNGVSTEICAAELRRVRLIG